MTVKNIYHVQNLQSNGKIGRKPSLIYQCFFTKQGAFSDQNQPQYDHSALFLRISKAEIVLT